jgi:ankyrin repeat protein
MEKIRMNFLHNLFGKKQKGMESEKPKETSSPVNPPQTVQIEDSIDKSSIDQKINELGWTRLHQAAYTGNLEFANRLISLGATVDSHDKYSNTPLCLAASGGQLDICKLLVQHGTNTKVEGGGYDTRRYYCPPILKAVDHECKSPEEEQRRKSVAEYLLELGADPNATLEPGKNSALHRAAWWGSFEIVKLLIMKGADVNARDWGNETPLTLAMRKELYKDLKPASRKSFRSIVKFLKKNGGIE